MGQPVDSSPKWHRWPCGAPGACSILWGSLRFLMRILRSFTLILVLYIFSGMIIPVVRVAKAQADRVAVTICEATQDCRWFSATLTLFLPIRTMAFQVASDIQTRQIVWVANGKVYDSVSLSAYYRKKYLTPKKCPISGYKYEKWESKLPAIRCSISTWTLDQDQTKVMRFSASHLLVIS